MKLISKMSLRIMPIIIYILSNISPHSYNPPYFQDVPPTKQTACTVLRMIVKLAFFLFFLNFFFFFERFVRNVHTFNRVVIETSRNLHKEGFTFFFIQNKLFDWRKIGHSVWRRNRRFRRESEDNKWTHSAFHILLSPRSILDWNSLPADVVSSDTLNSFKQSTMPTIRSAKVPSHLHRF